MIEAHSLSVFEFEMCLGLLEYRWNQDHLRKNTACLKAITKSFGSLTNSLVTEIWENVKSLTTVWVQCVLYSNSKNLLLFTLKLTKTTETLSSGFSVDFLIKSILTSKLTLNCNLYGKSIKRQTLFEKNNEKIYANLFKFAFMRECV